MFLPDYFFSGAVVGAAAFLLSFAQQLEAFLDSLQQALVFVSHPDLASFEHSFLSAGLSALAGVCGVWANVNPANRTTAENNKTTFFMVSGFFSVNNLELYKITCSFPHIQHQPVNFLLRRHNLVSGRVLSAIPWHECQ
jgi:hypothetical protein